MTCKDGHATAKTSIVMHHAVSDLMTNWSDLRVEQWFSDVGRNRGYAGVAHSYHCFNSKDAESFSQAQYCLHRYTADGNKYGWRLTQLIKYPFENACWHASNWPINQSSIGIETAGNYVSQYLDEKALMLVADTFRAWDKQLGGTLQIYGHKQFAATACPGKIYEQIPTLIDMFNNPAKWNEKLWPAPVDNLYRVFKAGKQIGAYSVRDNAFDKWYLQGGDQVTYKGKDITSEFKAEMNVLEKKVAALEADKKALQAEITALKKQNDELKVVVAQLEKRPTQEKYDQLKKQNDDLLAENGKLSGQVETLSKAVVELEKKLEACQEGEENLIKRLVESLVALIKKLWEAITRGSQQ